MVVAEQRRLLVDDVLYCHRQQHESVAVGNLQLLNSDWDALALRRDALSKGVQKCPNFGAYDL